jgi:two-component system, chemotaxis family, CheB/CheR fusion protein
LRKTTLQNSQACPTLQLPAGVVDFILSPKEIALELARLSKHPFVKANGDKNG